MKESKEAIKTLGEKPVPFVFSFDEGPPEKYFIGSEVNK